MIFVIFILLLGIAIGTMATVIIFESSGKGRRKHKYHLVLTGISNENTYIIMALTLSANEFSLGQLGLIDSDTLEVVSATFSNQSFSGTNDAAFTASPDGSDPNTVRVNGVAEGSGQVNFSAHADYTDKFGQPKSKDLSGSVEVTVTAVQQEQGVSLVVNFGAVQSQ